MRTDQTCSVVVRWRMLLLVCPVVLWLSAGAALADSVGNMAVYLDETLIDKPLPVSGFVDTDTSETGDLQVTIDWVDGYGRVVDRQVTVITLPGQTTVNFSFATDVALTMVNQISTSAVFVQTQNTLRSSYQSWNLVPDPMDHEDYHANVWGSGSTASPNYFAAIEQTNVNTGHIYRANAYYGHQHNVRPNHDFLEDKKWFEMTDAMHDPNYNTYKTALTATYDYYLPSKRQALIRPQSLTSTTSLSQLVSTVAARMQATSKWRPLQWNIADEYGIGRRASPFDYDLGQDCIDEFIIWLQGEYGTIGNLNSQWGTSFSDWTGLSDPINAPQNGDAARIICQEIRDREYPLYSDDRAAKNFSPWSDFRTHMDRTMANAMQVCVDAGRAIDATVPIGWEGGEAHSPMDGYDYWLQMQVMSSFEAYDYGNAPEYARAFRDNQYGQRLFRFITMFDTGSATRNRYALWFDLIHYGMRGSVIWSSANFFIDTISYNLTSYAWGLAPAYGEFRSGLAKLLSQGERDDGEIALYYSQRSSHIAWQYDSEVDGVTWINRLGSWDGTHSALLYTHTGWLKVLEDIGLKGRFVSYQQIANGDLITDGYKVLIMPRVMALSDVEMAAVQAFADAGGLVIGDVQTGVFDGHGKRRATADGGGWMDTWFGIDRPTYELWERNGLSYRAYTGSVTLLTPPPGFEILTRDLPNPVPIGEGFYAAEVATRIPRPEDDPGTAVGLFQNNPLKPVLIVKGQGLGKSIYMNLTLHRYGATGPDSNYSADRRNPGIWGAVNMRQLVKNMMELGGVTPKINVLQGHGAPDPPAGEEVYNLEKARYVDGDIVYLACVVNSWMSNSAEDWSTRSDTAEVLFGQPGVDVADVTLILDTAAHVYDVRAAGHPASYLGYGTRIDAAQPVLEGGIFALLPYEVTGLSMDSINFDSKQRASLTVSVQTASGSPGRHIFHIEVLDPSAQEMKHLTRNVVAPGGVFSGVIPFGVTEDIGGGTIRITDVATRAQVDYAIPLQPPLIQEVSPDPDTVLAESEYVEQLYLSWGSQPITWTRLQGPIDTMVDPNTGLVNGWTPQPGDVGSTFDFEVEASNAAGADTESWQVTVLSPPPPDIEQVSPDPDSALINNEYIRQLNLLAGGGTAVVWTLMQGPVDAQIDQNGLVDGWVPQPWQIGKSFTMEVKAENAYGFDTETWQVEVPPAIPGFVESGGMVVIEAEHYDTIKDGVAPIDDVWTFQTGHGSVGDGYMQVLPDNGDNLNDPDIESLSPRMSYVVNFSTAGTYYLWTRSEGPDNSGDSFHYGLDGNSISTSFADAASVPKSGLLEWQSQLTGGGGQPAMTIGSPGTHTVDIWMREDGCMIDRLLLTTDGGYTPSGEGPAESLRVPPLAGDLDHDGDVDLDDCTLLEAALNGPGVPASDPDADLDGDNDCDLKDLVIFMQNFSGSV